MNVAFEWEMLVGLLLGGSGFLVGALVRLGYLRRFITIYTREDLPSYVRNTPFALGPFGATFLLWWLAIALDSWGASSVLSIYIFLLSVPVALAGLFISTKGPSWSKPAWLAEGGKANQRTGHVHLPRVHYVVAWLVVAGGSLAVWALLDRPLAGLLIGLAFVIPLLLSVRPTRKTEG